jgi:prepilin-type N-terminal cleavage/methylation domain-containing protein
MKQAHDTNLVIHSLRLKRGFTLIELLLVVSIIGLFASTTFAYVQTARARATNSAQQQTVRGVSTALAAMIADRGVAPQNYGTPGSIAWSNAPKTLDSGTKNAYDKVIDELKAGNYLAVTPAPARSDLPMGYYNFGKGTPSGAVFYGKLADVSNWAGGGGSGSSSSYSGSSCLIDPIRVRIPGPSVPGSCPQAFRSYAEYTNSGALICFNSSGQAYAVPGNGYSANGCALFTYVGMQCQTVCQGNVCYPGGGPDPVGTWSYSIPTTPVDMSSETACTGVDSSANCRCNPF